LAGLAAPLSATGVLGVDGVSKMVKGRNPPPLVEVPEGFDRSGVLF